MNTLPWISILLDRYPDTHPHHWEDTDLRDYEALCEGIPVDSWVKLDNELFSRQCSLTGCDSPVHGTMKAYMNFDGADYLEEGNPSDWSKDQWTFFAHVCELVQDVTMQMMQDEVAARVSGELPDDTDEKQAERAEKLAVSLPKSTDQWELEDWATLDAYLQDREVLQEKRAEEELDHIVGTVDDSPIMTPAPVSGKACNCNGPGAEIQKYNDHLQHCPANPIKPATGSGVVVVNTGPKKGDPCLDSCKGPGHPNNPKDENGDPKAPYKTHTFNCPQHPNFTPGSTTYSGSSCKHDRKAKPFKLLNGLSIKAISYSDEKNVDDEDSDIGVYLYSSWWWYGSNDKAVKLSPDFKTQPAWMKKVKQDKTKKEPLFTQQVILDWPDFNVPSEALPMVDIVQWMLQQMEAGKKFETACMGGHGRTGTMLALLLVAQGMPPGSAIARVRKHHCSKGIENEKQGRYVAEFYKMVHGNEDWKKVKSQRQLFNKEVNNGHKDKNKSKSGSKASTSSASVTKTTYPEPKFDPKLKLYWSEKFIPGYRKDPETKLYISEHRDGEPPVWNEELKLWCHQGYHPNFEWNKLNNCYTSPHKNGQPSVTVGKK